MGWSQKHPHVHALTLADNLVHCSYEAGVLEDPDHTPPKELWT